MKITVLGRGNVGGGLAALWTAAGHTVTTLGRDGGDATDADVLVVAVPGDRVADALARVTGIAGTPAIDATNVYGPRDPGHESNAHLVRSLTGGPVAKSFSANFASEYPKWCHGARSDVPPPLLGIMQTLIAVSGATATDRSSSRHSRRSCVGQAVGGSARPPQLGARHGCRRP